MKFVSGIKCEDPDSRGLWFIFREGKLYCFRNGESYKVPELAGPSEAGIKTGLPLFLGKADNKNCWAAEAEEGEGYIGDCCPAVSGEYRNLRELIHHLGDELFALAGRALQLCSWRNSWRFCPSCGKALADSETERAKVCHQCSGTYYPVISPAIIVAVSRGDRLLLARNNRYQNFRRFSILAGFVEAGESLEETVAREVEEEVGIKVKNIRYFGSQSWPFPHSLMIGFTAEHESGEIAVDGIEIGEAGWFKADALPEIPPHGSISRLLIDDFVSKNIT